jgi:hypothetical protein
LELKILSSYPTAQRIQLKMTDQVNLPFHCVTEAKARLATARDASIGSLWPALPVAIGLGCGKTSCPSSNTRRKKDFVKRVHGTLP